MILVDANLLIYAHVNAFAQHQAARDWLDAQLNDVSRVGLPWVSLLVVLRIVTNPRIFGRPEPIADARAQVVGWLACDTMWVPEPTEHHSETLGRLIALPGVHGNLVRMPMWQRSQ